MYAARASQFAKTITMACSVQKQASQPSSGSGNSSTASLTTTTTATPSAGAGGPRGSLPLEAHRPPLDEFHWPARPVSTHTSNLRLAMMNHDAKDLHTARLIIEELRSKVRYQTEHIMKWRKAYAMQIQQHYRYQKEKSDQMNALTSQLLLLESRLKRKQKQIATLLHHREQTIQRQQKVIDTLSGRLADHGLDSVEAFNYTAELDSLNDSDSAVVLEDIDSDSNVTFGGLRRRSSGGGGGGGGVTGADGITIVRSISDAIETNLNKYGGVRRNNCFLRRPEILETVYSVEEDPEPTTDVAEKRDKFRQRSEKALSSSSTEGQIDNATSGAQLPTKEATAPAAPAMSGATPPARRQFSSPTPLQRQSPTQDGYTACSMRVPQLQRNGATNHSNNNNNSNNNHTSNIANRHGALDADVPMIDEDVSSGSGSGCSGAPSERSAAKAQVTTYNRVMSNHRSVTKPKDVKYKRINKAKSKSLEELRGRLKNLVERGSTLDAGSGGGYGNGNGYATGMLPPTAQSYA